MSILLRAQLCSPCPVSQASRAFSTIRHLRKDPRLEDVGRLIKDEFAVLRDKYGDYTFYTILCDNH